MIDFFEGETEINSEFFGICDDPDTGVKTPAYIDSDIGNENKWTAVVNNHSKAPVYFNPIDNNIEIKRENGEMENRCDALLHNNYWIAFIELKVQKRNWIKRAVEEQLVPTINVFKQNHDISRFKHRYAYACNRLKPKFSYSHKIEMQECFGFSLGQYLFYGGYPGAATLIGDEDRFGQYIQSTIIEATINKDILMDTPISKPALLRQTFELGAAYSGELLSLNKMLGSLQDAGNTVTLAGYINLLDESGLLRGLQKFSTDMARRRASIPKFQVYNNALKMVYSPLTFEQAILDRKSWGRIFESGIGAWLVSQAFVHRFEVFYWRERDDEVDFVLRKKGSVVAIEVKSNGEKRTEGLDKFRKLFNPQAAFIVGDGGISAEDFLSMDLRKLF